MAVKPTEARAIARSAYVFLYPLVVNYGTMYAEALDPTSPFFGGGFGEWIHQCVTSSRETAVSADHATATRGTVWLDLRSEPWTLSIPATDATSSRVVVTADLWDFLLDETGPDDHAGRTLLMVSPEWTGGAPADVDRVIRGESAFVRIDVLTETDGPANLDHVRMTEQKLAIAPASPRSGARPATPAAISWWPYGEHALTGLEFWSVANFALSLTTPHDQDRMLLERLATIGVSPGRRWDPGSFTLEVVEAIGEGMNDALTDLMRATSGPDPRPRRSREATDLDYFHRAVGALAHDGVARAASSLGR
jgi:hypothetical protein